jgi:hypothetical protein
LPVAEASNGNGADSNGVRWHKDSPPVAGARLGRDAEGNPGWYLPDGSGGYTKVESH